MSEEKGHTPTPVLADISGKKDTSQPDEGRSCLIFVIIFFVLGIALGGLTARYIVQSRISEDQTTHIGVKSPQDDPLPPDRLVFNALAERPERTPDMLNEGIPVVYAFFSFPGAGENDAITIRWWHDGTELTSPPTEDMQTTKEDGILRGQVMLKPETGTFTAGIYEVEVMIGDAVETASFVIMPGAEDIAGAEVPTHDQLKLSDGVMATEIRADGSPEGIKRRFTSGKGRFYACFRYAQAEPGIALTVYWYGEDIEITAARREVVLLEEEGWANAWIETEGTSELPAGRYSVRIMVSGDETPLLTIPFEVG